MINLYESPYHKIGEKLSYTSLRKHTVKIVLRTAKLLNKIFPANETSTYQISVYFESTKTAIISRKAFLAAQKNFVYIRKTN